MSAVLINDTTMTSIAEAIRSKDSSSEKMLPSEMAGKIQAISTGIPIPSPIVGGETVVMTSSKDTAVVTNKSMTATGILLQVKKAGTYRFKFSIAKKKSASGNNSTDSDSYAKLYKNGRAIPGAVCGDKAVSKANFSQDIAAAVNDTFEIYAQGSTDSDDNPIQCNITSALTIGVALDLSYFT